MKGRETEREGEQEKRYEERENKGDMGGGEREKGVRVGHMRETVKEIKGDERKGEKVKRDGEREDKRKREK